MGAIGIQFDRVAKFLYFINKAENIFVESGFASGDTDAFQNTLAFFQNFKHVLHGNHRLLARREDKSAVVAEGTSEIAASQKNGGSYFAGIVQKRCFVKTIDWHKNPPLGIVWAGP